MKNQSGRAAIQKMLATGCLVFCPLLHAEKAYGPQNYISELEKAISEFKQAESVAVSDPKKVPEYVQAGLTMSNVSCDAWLVALGKSDRDTNVFKDMLNIVGNLILGVGGINGWSSATLGRGALALGASNAALDAYRSDVLMGVISDIEPKIKSGRKISEDLLLEQIPADRQAAKRRLLEYHDQCTPTAVKELLKTSLAQVAYARPDTSLGREINEAKAAVMAGQLSATLYAGTPGIVLTADDIYKLWVVRIAYPAQSPSPVVDTYKSDGFVASVAALYDAKNGQGQLAPILKQIGEFRNYPKRLEQEIAKNKQDTRGDEERQALNAISTALDDERRARISLTTAKEGLSREARRLTEAASSKIPEEATAAAAALQVLSDNPGAVQGEPEAAGRAMAQAQGVQRSARAADTVMLQARLAEVVNRTAEVNAALARQALAQQLLNQRQAIAPVSAPAQPSRSITPVIVPITR